MSVRVPFVQEVIKRVFNTSELSWSLHTDGSSALGAAYIAARNSDEFDVAPIDKISRLTALVVLLTRGQTYNIFTPGELENKTTVLTVPAKKGQAFVVATGEQKEYYQKFTFKLPGNFFRLKEVNVTLTFAVDKFLLPVLVSSIDADGNTLVPQYEVVGWEVSEADKKKFAEKVNMMLTLQETRKEKETAAHELRSLLSKLQRFADTTAGLDEEKREEVLKIVAKERAWLEGLKERLAEAEEYRTRIKAIHEATDATVEAFFDAASVFTIKIEQGLNEASDLIEEAHGLPGVAAGVLDEAARFVGDLFVWYNEHGDKAEVAELRERRTRLKKKLLQFKQFVQTGRSQANGSSSNSN
jgi:molecular chaperone DnaK (HSP70)